MILISVPCAEDGDEHSCMTCSDVSSEEACKTSGDWKVCSMNDVSNLTFMQEHKTKLRKSENYYNIIQEIAIYIFAASNKDSPAVRYMRRDIIIILDMPLNALLAASYGWRNS